MSQVDVTNKLKEMQMYSPSYTGPVLMPQSSSRPLDTGSEYDDTNYPVPAPPGFLSDLPAGPPSHGINKADILPGPYGLGTNKHETFASPPVFISSKDGTPAGPPGSNLGGDIGPPGSKQPKEDDDGAPVAPLHTLGLDNTEGMKLVSIQT